MDFQKKTKSLKKHSFNRIIHGRMKRVTALVMAAIMAVSAPLPGMSFPSRAASDPNPLTPDTTMKDNGGGLTTAYKFGSNLDYDVNPNNPGVSKGFDIEGIEDPALIGAPNPFTGDVDRAIETTYRKRVNNVVKKEGFGYQTAIAKPDEKYGKVLSIDTNGGVQDFDGHNAASPVMGVQVQMKLYPSDDQKWILVDYIVHNTRNAENTVKLGTVSDIKLGARSTDGRPSNPGQDPADGSQLFYDAHGFHMLNKKTKVSFDLRYNNDELGLTPPTTRWVGVENDKNANRFSGTAVSGSIDNVDSGLAYSWTIDMAPYETVTKRVAFGTKGSSFYVDSTYAATSDGNYTSPFKTIEEAIQAICTATPSLKGKNTNIYMMHDYDLNKPIVIPEGYDITIQSTDLDRSGNAFQGTIQVTRGQELRNSPMFSTSNGTMHFSDIVLDGGGADRSGQPILSADSGNIFMTNGAKLQNNVVTASGMGSAINITGTANLAFNYGDVTGNTGTDRGAVNYSSSGFFNIEGVVHIDGNIDASGNKANVYLPDSKTITVAAGLDGSHIGITSEWQPDFSPEGVTTRDNQEFIVAVPMAGSSVDTAPSPFVADFFADKANADGTGPYAALECV